MKCSRCGNTWQDVSVYACPECGYMADVVEGEDSYSAGVEAERQGKYKTAIAHYSLAADLGNPCAAYSVCRTMEKSGEWKKDPQLYEFWLSCAAREDVIAAVAYAKYLKRRGDEQQALRYLIWAADRGHDGSALRLGWYYLNHGNRPGARYYFDRSKGFFAAVMRLVTLKKAAAYPPKAPEVPDDTVETYGVGQYALGLGLPHIAYSYFEKAADASYLPAIRQVAEMCMQGRGTARDEEKVQKYMTELGEAGDTDAYVRLGDYFESGLIGEGPNPHAAYEYYLLAAEQGNLRGMLMVGDFLYDGNGVEKNMMAALVWYDKAAALGDATARTRATTVRNKAKDLVAQGKIALGACEDHKAFLHFSSAKDMGNVDALVYLGDCYVAGRVCERHLGTAVSYYEAAAKAGNPLAKYRLGVLYMTNFGVKFNARKAKAYLTEALTQGVDKAQIALEQLNKRKQKYLAQKVYAVSCAIYHRGDSAEAAKFRHVATKMGHGRAGYLLGCMYDCGDGVAKDPVRAQALHEQALKRGFDGRSLGWLSKYLRHLPR